MTDQQKKESSQPTSMVFFILVAAFLIRVIWLFVDPHVIVADEVEYQKLAVGVANGEGYGNLFWPPGYPLVLGVVYFIFGSNPAIAIGFNLVLSLLILIVSSQISQMLFDSRTSKLHLALMAFMPSYILTISLIRYEIVLQFVLVLALWVSLNKWSWRNIVVIAFLTALASLMRPLMIFWPFLIWVVNPNRGSIREEWLKIIGAQVLAILFITPWIIYASSIAGRFVPIALNGGINLWIGNNPNATGAYMSPPGAFWDPQNEANATKEAIDFIVSHPMETVSLMPKKIAYSLGREHWPVDWIFLKTDPENSLITYESLSISSNIYYYIVVVLALIGVGGLLWGGQYARLLPLLLIIYSIAGQLPFFGSPRFRWITQFVLIMYATALPSIWQQLIKPKLAQLSGTKK